MCAANSIHDVLIVGAGPTGLALGIELARRGVPFLLIERDATPPTTSRAIGLQTRTGEMLQLLGIPRNALQPSVENLQIKFSERTAEACVLGAVAVVLDDILRELAIN